MPHIHILDLAEDGVIKPHVDSSRVSEILSHSSDRTEVIIQALRRRTRNNEIDTIVAHDPLFIFQFFLL